MKLQNGRQVYSDGEELEREALLYAQKYPGKLAEEHIGELASRNNVFSPRRQAILNWFPFKPGARILEVGAGMGAVTGLLLERAVHVTAVEQSETRSAIIRARYKGESHLDVVCADFVEFSEKYLSGGGKKFDYAVMVGVLEYAELFVNDPKPFHRMLSEIKNVLTDDGILLFAIENRFGMKYWSGASEQHIGRPFVGITGYKEPKTPKTFSKRQLDALLREVGFAQNRFYYPMPNYHAPSMIFTDEYAPKGVMLRELQYVYGHGSTLIFNELDVYDDVIDEGLFGFFANAFLVEASARVLPKEHVIFAQVKKFRSPEYRICLTISSEKTVLKSPDGDRAIPHIRHIFDNYKKLKERGVPMVPCEYDGVNIVMPFCEDKKADVALAECIKNNDFDGARKLVDLLKAAILKSSEVDENGMLYDVFWELGFYNSFYDGKQLTFFDQENIHHNLRPQTVLFRAIDTVFQIGGLPGHSMYEKLLKYAEAEGESDAHAAIEEPNLRERLSETPYFIEDMTYEEALLASRETRYEALLASTSWRITAPLRAIMRKIRRADKS
ncbi:hypothetical protein FACS1894208_10690 [Clostridia bacterium]|nr:hypothetical protein FACS1894208_10690 [Clostridia bacterium]